MTGAIEFLRKAKAIDDLSDKEQIVFALINYIYEMDNKSEADLVRKVMDYRLEDKDAERN